MTFAEARKQGYICGDTTYTQGYISRRAFDIDKARIHVAGGSRKGQLFVLIPCYNSTRFCLRQYLKKDA